MTFTVKLSDMICQVPLVLTFSPDETSGRPFCQLFPHEVSQLGVLTGTQVSFKTEVPLVTNMISGRPRGL